MSYRGRFAPSPTGDLHAGSLLAALGSWLLARRAGGEWLVRIEDVDRRREVAGAAERQLNALAAFGLEADGEIVRQSDRSGLYARALQVLLDDGHAFECWCSRAELGTAVHRRCLHGPVPGRVPAVRLRVAEGMRATFEDGAFGRVEQALDADVGDFVLRRADGLWAYQLAVVVDDAAQGITDVVRGADLLDSTPRQIHLQRLLDVHTPRYVHLPLVVGADGRKLSKSDAAHPIDPNDPLPALRAAWLHLGQDGDPSPGARGPREWLDAAIERFDMQAVASAAVRHANAAPRA